MFIYAVSNARDAYGRLAEASPVEGSEGQVVFRRAVEGGRGIANRAPVAHESVAHGTGAPADGMGERNDRALVGGPVEVVDEGQMLGHQGAGCDVEGMLEEHDGGELGRVDEVGHRRRGGGRRRKAPAGHRVYDAGSAATGALAARSAATCWR